MTRKPPRVYVTSKGDRMHATAYCPKMNVNLALESYEKDPAAFEGHREWCRCCVIGDAT